MEFQAQDLLLARRQQVQGGEHLAGGFGVFEGGDDCQYAD